ncbi:MAG: amidohydrolase family protein [Pseudolabrys sp.]|nr:amidohydrolase family protein [Pseudolabrys sp.]MBV9261100.1 amidohydrolase family protein [Pseudolabrys sp.]
MRCDSHIHIVGSAERYPQLPNRSGTMGLAQTTTVQRLGAARGITRFVVVQPSFYGTDNSMMLAALDAFGGHGRGVAVIDPSSPNLAMLADWHKRGVRGLRLNLYSPVGPEKSIERDFAALAEIARRVQWHIQVIASIDKLVTHVGLLTTAPVPVVLDHYGVYGEERPHSEAGRALLRLLSSPHVWVKLSAPYRVSDDPLETKPNRAWLDAILAVASDRCVWGSDWPHTPPHESRAPAYRAIDYAGLVDDFLAALPPSFANTVMRDNPARLYGYPAHV